MSSSADSGIQWNADRSVVVETHLSVLFFFAERVLKYKKPLRFPFVDFTTIDSRHGACVEEVVSNQRLSRDVYLGVADVGFGGETLDHAVVMRRMPEDRSLATLVRLAHSGDGDPRLPLLLRRLAALIAGFHSSAERSAEISRGGEPETLARLWRGCIEGIRPYGGQFVPVDAAGELDVLASRYLAGRGQLLEERIANRRICDGHGDLLADDIYLLEDGPRVLDCIEFDARLRHVDVAADIAFLLMDLERMGAQDLAGVFLASYVDASGEVIPQSLLDFYIAERAAVRAEVACLRAAQGDTGAPAEAGRLVDIALGHLRASQVCLVVVSGLPGTGKSTLAAAAGEHLRWPVLGSDEIRHELFGEEGLAGRLGDDAYSPEATERTYETMLDRARIALGRGQSVVLDATFNERRRQVEAMEVAGSTSSSLVAIRCSVPMEVAARRVAERAVRGDDLSDADEDVLATLAGISEPWPEAVVIDTSGPAGEEALGELLSLVAAARSRGS